MELSVTKKQMQFIRADCDEVLFGGAAGGGKSHAQLVDALYFALTYPKSRQLILRRTFPELERSLVVGALLLYPKQAGDYLSSRHLWQFRNGSTIEFGHLTDEKEVVKYQSAEYDIIRFDELTHFTKFQYLHLLSRVRGTNGYPKQMKSTTNPGGVGHDWVKQRFIDPRPPEQRETVEGRSYLFIPARVTDNSFLMRADSGYVKRLEALPEQQRRALLHGQWDIFEGRFFSEFDRTVHVTEAFDIPAHWKRYRSIDYGLDMLACYWTAFSPDNQAVVYRELYQSGLIISQAAGRILQLTPPSERIEQTFAPPDLWGRGADSGKSQATIFSEQGLSLTRVSAARVAGWANLREWLRVTGGQDGRKTARLVIAKQCVNLIRCLSSIAHDPNNPDDCAVHPHELTHAPDSLRYLMAGQPKGDSPETWMGQYESFLDFGT